MSKSDRTQNSNDDESAEGAHLDQISDGCGCVETWETLSKYRR